MKRLSIMAALTAACGLTQAASAQDNLSWKTQTYVERISTDVNGNRKRTLIPAGRLDSGDRLVFVIDFRNMGPQPMAGFAITTPVSGRLAIDAGQAGLEVSADGGRNWGRIGALLVPNDTGGMRLAGAADITHIRVRVADAVAPGRSGRIAYRAVVR